MLQQMLSSIKTQPRRDQYKLLALTDFNDLWKSRFGGRPFVIDFETNTANPTASDLYVRCISLANADYVVSIDFKEGGDFDGFKQWLLQQQIIAHNSKFDFGILFARTGKLIKPYADTFGAFAHLANFIRISWSLKNAQVSFLGWDAKGDVELKEYMKSKQLTWADVEKFDFNILGIYNAYDADSTWQLYTHIKNTVESYNDSWGQFFWQAHTEDYLEEVLLLIESQFEGLHINSDKLDRFGIYLDANIQLQLDAFLNDPNIKEYIEDYDRRIIENEEKKNKPKFTAKGEINKNWLKWQELIKKLKSTTHFNINSSTHLKWLFFDCLKIEPTRFSVKTGAPQCDKKALKAIPKYGNLLLGYRELVTTRKFVTQVQNVKQDNKLIPNIVLPATVTGRAASKEEI